MESPDTEGPDITILKNKYWLIQVPWLQDPQEKIVPSRCIILIKFYKESLETNFIFMYKASYIIHELIVIKVAASPIETSKQQLWA